MMTLITDLRKLAAQWRDQTCLNYDGSLDKCCGHRDCGTARRCADGIERLVGKVVGTALNQSKRGD
jgi:hypothetical protein